MQRSGEEILAHADGLPEGTSVSAEALLHLGKRAAVDQALSRGRSECPRPHNTSSSPVSLSGSSRTMKLGRQVVELRHAPSWQLILGNRPAGEAVRALAWLAQSVGKPGYG